MTAQRGETARKHAAWLRECARRADALAAEYRANADRIEARADAAAVACTCDADLVPPHPAHLPWPTGADQ